MEIWEVEEDHLIALIYEINRLGQTLLKFGEQAYGPFFSSRLAEITLSMLGLDRNSNDSRAGDDGISGDGVNGFDAGSYSYLFNSEVFLNENLIGEILAGIRQNSEGFYKTKAQTTQTGSSVVWEIDQRLILDLIKEVNRLRLVMGRLEGDSYDAYFSTDLPNIILKMLGIPEDYSGTTPEDLPELVKSRDDDNKTGTDEKPPATQGRAGQTG
jgi:hypothetical protein